MNNISHITSLVVFVEVAQKGSFTLAGRKLNMSKSAVSNHIKKLEEQFQVQLLSRNTRNMALTSTGKRLLEQSTILRDQADYILKDLTVEEEISSGLFSVTFPFLLERSVAMPALRQLCIEFPKIELRIEVTEKTLDLIEEGLDVALFAGELPDSNYRSQPISKVTEHFYASPEYLLTNGKINSTEDLHLHRWIAVNWQSQHLKLKKQGASEATQLKLTPHFRCNSLSGAIAMVEQGMGIALLPSIIGQRLVNEGKLQRVLDPFVNKIWQFHFVHPFRGKKPRHVERFQQLVKQYFSQFSDFGY